MAAANTNNYYDPPPGGNKQQAQGQQQNEPSVKKRVYIGNLPPETSREELKELGSKYGRVIGVELIRAKDGRLPFGFISFLSEEDAGYTAYMLHDHVYKNFPLEASLSSKVQPKQKPGTPRQGGGGGNAAAPAKVKPKKKLYSLRTLTPLNPPTQTNQAVQPNMKNYTQNLNDDQGLGSPNLAPFGWTDNPADVPQAPLGRASNPGQNNQDFNNQPRNNNKFNNNQGSNQKNNNNNNRNRGSAPYNRRAQDTPQFEGDDDFDNTEQVPVTEQDSPPALNQLPPQDSKRQNQKGQNRNTNNPPKTGQQQKKLGSNSGGQQHTVDASIQYTQGGPTSNVQVNVATAPKKISINFKLNVNQLDEFLNVIQPYIQEEHTVV